MVQQRLWLQLALYAISIYLLVELSNQNALLRVRSRMVSASFIMLSCTAPFLFPSLSGGITQLCFIIAFVFLFRSYQDRQSVRNIYFAFASIGTASLVFVQTLWYVPLLWLLLATQLLAMSWRSWLASLIGLATPYWFALTWLLCQQDLSPIAEHFSPLAHLSFSVGHLMTGHILVFLFTAVMSAASIIHFWNNSFEDNIRVRLIYGLLTTMTICTLLAIVAQPQHFDNFIRIAFVTTCPLTAHVLTFTNSRLSNVLFFVAAGTAVVITVFNLWMLSSNF